MKTPKELCEAVAQYQAGNTEAFNRIYELSYQYLHTCIIHVMKNEEGAMDMLQETYLEISRSILQLRETEQFLSWAAVIANRKCYAFLKANRQEILLNEGTEEESNFFENIADDEEFIPESVLQDREKQRLIREIIDSLSEMQRLCVIGFYYNEQKQEEIAKELNIPVSTVKSHLNRAKGKIKEAVVDLHEKKGTRLYAVAPFLLLFFGMEAEACEVTEMPKALKNGLQDLSDQNRAVKGMNGQTAKAGKMALKTKMIIGAAAAVLGGGVIFGIATIPKQPQEKVVATKEADLQEESLETPVSEEGESGKENEAATEEMKAEMPDEKEGADPTEFIEFSELFSLDEYESFGYAFGGVIPVKKDGLWGAINYRQEEIVPCEYMGFYAAPNENGYFVLTNSTFVTQTVSLDDMSWDYELETKEYTLFDSQGKVVYCGNDEVKASGNMYILLHEDPEGNELCTITYYSMNGTQLAQAKCEGPTARINGFYDGISTVYSASDSDEFVAQIGTVDENGNISWVDDPGYLKMLEEKKEWEAQQQKEQENSNNIVEANGYIIEGSGAGGWCGYVPRNPISTMNHGYYITDNAYLEAGFLQVYDENYREICQFNLWHAVPDSDAGFTVQEYGGNADNCSYRGFFHDGCVTYNYGAHMVITMGDRDVLVDFAKKPGMTEETMDNSVILAVYDKIYMGDSTYWLVCDNDKWKYIDHEGNVVAEYDDGTLFYKGYAAVIHDGHAYLVDETFKEWQDLGPAESVGYEGELIVVVNGDHKQVYGIKEENNQ